MKVFFRVSLAFVFCLLFVVSLTKPVLAAETPLSNFSTTDVNPDVPQNVHSLTQIVTTEVLSTMVCQLTGKDFLNRNQPCLGIDPKTHAIGFAPNNGGLIGATANGIIAEFNIPIHTSGYIHYLTNEFGVGRAYAAATNPGVGFTGLEPLLGLWTAFRNIVYLFFVIIFVLVGIAIMFRVQIDPRTVMTLENQLPKIVIGLILVTFSYAIAGVLIDLMWLITFLVINVLGSADPSAPTLTKVATNELLQGPLGYINNVLSSNNFGGVLDVSGVAAKAIWQVVNNIFTVNNMAKIGLPDNSNQNLLTIVTGGLEAFFGAILGVIFGAILGLLGFLIILIALLITMFRVWFALLQAFAYIILDVILAPFYIAAGLIPGSAIGFGSWVRGMAGNLLAFPTVVFMFVLARVLLDAFGTTTTVTATGAIQQAYAATTTVGGGSLFEPPLIGSFNGNGAGNPLGAFVALAIIFATPAVMGVIKKALQVEDNGLGGAALASATAGLKSAPRAARSIGGSIIDFTQGRNPMTSINPGVGAVVKGLFGR